MSAATLDMIRTSLNSLSRGTMTEDTVASWHKLLDLAVSHGKKGVSRLLSVFRLLLFLRMRR